MKNIYKIPLMFLFVVLVFSSCKKDDDPEIKEDPKCDLTINVEHNIAGKTIIFDTIRYTNEAGEKFSVSKIEYYLVNFELKDEAGNWTSFNNVQYINPKKPEFTTFTLKDIPDGKYTSIKFRFGIDTARNYTNLLPNTAENRNMFWPEVMGGGYHHMKFEGKFINGKSESGFGLHVGTKMTGFDVEITKDITICSDDSVTLMANMEEWFKNPAVFSLIKDGHMTMGNMPLMKKVSNNGSTVFSIK